MTRDPTPPPNPTETPSRPRALLLAALALAGLGCLIRLVAPDLSAALRLGPVFLGSILAIEAVRRQLRQARWDWLGRLQSAAVVSLTTVVTLLSYLSMAANWESGQMFYAAACLVTLVGIVLLLLPLRTRRVALSLLVLFHFTGMAVTITSIDPPGAAGPWVSKQLWTWVYRPYLSFLYLTNAYHFYSPDPGPPSLLWFAVRDEEGDYRWVKLPERANSPVGMHYQRLLALPEHSFSPMPWPILPTAVRGGWEMIYHRRELGSILEYPTPDGPRVIPMVADVDLSAQYREPNAVSKQIMGSLARRVFWTEQAKQPRRKIKSVKIYRVTHQILTPAELAAGTSPLAKEKHWPYFLGEYDGAGRLIDSLDPFLYWYLPILKVPSSYPNHGQSTRPGVAAVNVRSPAPREGFLLDGLEMHAAGRLTGRTTEDKK